MNSLQTNINLKKLTDLCRQEGILDSKQGFLDESKLKAGYEKWDLIDSGIIDSLGLLSLQTLIEEHYHLLIPQELFVMELRSLEKIAMHISLVELQKS